MLILTKLPVNKRLNTLKQQMFKSRNFLNMGDPNFRMEFKYWKWYSKNKMVTNFKF